MERLPLDLGQEMDGYRVASFEVEIAFPTFGSTTDLEFCRQ